MVDIDRVVEGLVVPLEYPHPPVRLPGGLEDDLLEKIFVDEVGAGGRQDQAR